MNIRSKWLRGLFACLMLGSVGFVAGCADEAADTGESLDDTEAGSDETGGGGVETP